MGEQVHAVRVRDLGAGHVLDQIQLMGHECGVTLLDELVRLIELAADDHVVGEKQRGDGPADVRLHAFHPDVVAAAAEREMEFAEHVPQDLHVRGDRGIADVELAPDIVHAVLLRRGDEQALDDLVAALHRAQSADVDRGIDLIAVIVVVLVVEPIPTPALRFDDRTVLILVVDLLDDARDGLGGHVQGRRQLLPRHEIAPVQQVVDK